MNIALVLNDADGLNLSGIQNIQANVSPAPLRVEFFIDDTLIGSATTSPYMHGWDTTKFPNGTHVLRCEGVYKTRRSKTQMAVTVSNTSQPAMSGYGSGAYGNGNYGG